MAGVNVFVASRGNLFMREIATWIVEAARETGRAAELVDDRLPSADGSINLVVAPHEFFELSAAAPQPRRRAAAASVCINTEQPGTPWFTLALGWCLRGPLTLDISDQGANALRGHGLSVDRLRLGGVASMRAPGQSAERPVDVVFMGGLDDRRGAALAELAPHLWHRPVDIRLTGIDRPIDASTPHAVFGADKQRLLSSAKLLLNIHRDRDAALGPYFEWARAVEAMANHCVIVSEPSDGCAPLAAGVHFVEADLRTMPNAIEQLLDDEDRRSAIASAAEELIFGDLALRTSLGPILDTIELSLTIEARPTATRQLLDHLPTLPRRRQPRRQPFRPFLPLIATAKRVAMAENVALSRLDAASCQLAHGAPQHIVRVETPAFAAARPRATAIVSLYNYAHLVSETLESIIASENIDFEVIVIDDHSTDDGRAVVEQFLGQHPTVPMQMIAKDANEGLSAARNTGFEAARAPLVMVMDADNLIYPTCLAKLADALDGDPQVDAVYSILEDFGEQRNVRSALAWDVNRLLRANYIDAQSMIRKSAWQRLSGYTRDSSEIFGWEDWDFWLRLAESGGRARLVTEILGRYRVQRGSMLALSNLMMDEQIAAMRRRHPTLPWPDSTGAQ